MNRKPECVQLQSRLVDFFSDPAEPVPEEISQHLNQCEQCRIEFEQMKEALELVKQGETVMETVPEHLLAQINDKLGHTAQMPKPVLTSNHQRNMLILQYSYLSLMAVIIWFSIMLIQPLFNNWLQNNELVMSMPILAEYGLFIFFFAAGGIFAAISSPLLIRKTNANLPVGEKSSYFRRLFSGLSIFAC